MIHTQAPALVRLDVGALHESNLRNVLTVIAANPGGTAADASRSTGLSASTVSRLVDLLVERALVTEGDRVRGKRGQPGISLYVDAGGAYSVGIQIGFGACYLIVRAMGGAIVGEQTFTITNCDATHIAEACATALAVALEGQPAVVHQRMVGIGVAVPVDFDQLCQKLHGADAVLWDEPLFRATLQRASGLEVSTYSSGSAAAWGELSLLETPRPTDFMHVFVDCFVQSGLLLNGNLWVGPGARYGSLGRTFVPGKNGPIRLYDLLGGHAFLQHGVASTEVRDDPRTEAWLAEAAFGLAAAIQGVAHSLDLPLVVVDGTIPSHLLEQLAPRLEHELTAMMWANPPKVQRGLAGPKGPARGAAERPIHLAFF